MSLLDTGSRLVHHPATLSFDSELRRAADEFMLTVAVVAEAEGADPKTLALTAITDAVARLNEQGALGADEDDE